MADIVYTLTRNAETSTGKVKEQYGKFFTSPYNAMISAAEFMKNDPISTYTVSMLGLDLADVPCDHIAAIKFEQRTLNIIHRGTHLHKFSLWKKSPCVFDVHYGDTRIGQVTFVYNVQTFDTFYREYQIVEDQEERMLEFRAIWVDATETW